MPRLFENRTNISYHKTYIKKTYLAVIVSLFALLHITSVPFKAIENFKELKIGIQTFILKKKIFLCIYQINNLLKN